MGFSQLPVICQVKHNPKSRKGDWRKFITSTGVGRGWVHVWHIFRTTFHVYKCEIVVSHLYYRFDSYLFAGVVASPHFRNMIIFLDTRSDTLFGMSSNNSASLWSMMAFKAADHSVVYNTSHKCSSDCVDNSGTEHYTFQYIIADSHSHLMTLLSPK